MTLDQLAVNLQLSKNTVSHALNGKGRMGEETRERVCAAALFGRRRIAYLGAIAVPLTLRLGATNAPNVGGA